MKVANTTLGCFVSQGTTIWNREAMSTALTKVFVLPKVSANWNRSMATQSPNSFHLSRNVAAGAGFGSRRRRHTEQRCSRQAFTAATDPPVKRTARAIARFEG